MKKKMVFSLLLSLSAFTLVSLVANDESVDTKIELSSHDHHHHNHHHDKHCKKRTEFKKNDVVVEVQQRFYKFQNATSNVKRTAHDPDASANAAALQLFGSFLSPQNLNYSIVTSGFNVTYTTPAEVVTAYQEFGAIFNSFSQHFSTDAVVDEVPGSHGRQATLVSGGGEWASLLTTTCPNEQITISDFAVTWEWLDNGPTGPDWYIIKYLETGDRLYRICPPGGPVQVMYTRPFPGMTCEPTESIDCNSTTGSCCP